MPCAALQIINKPSHEVALVFYGTDGEHPKFCLLKFCLHVMRRVFGLHKQDLFKAAHSYVALRYADCNTQVCWGKDKRTFSAAHMYHMNRKLNACRKQQLPA